MEEYLKVLDRLQAQCSKREYCSSDILRKGLSAFDGDREQASRLLESLIQDRFVDDLRYATAFARDKACLDGWGPVKIAFQLRGKGIDASTVDKALGEVDADKADARMRAVLEAKARTLKGDPELRLKLLKFGLQRGYEYDRLNPAVKALL